MIFENINYKKYKTKKKLFIKKGGKEFLIFFLIEINSKKTFGKPLDKETMFCRRNMGNVVSTT